MSWKDLSAFNIEDVHAVTVGFVAWLKYDGLCTVSDWRMRNSHTWVNENLIADAVDVHDLVFLNVLQFLISFTCVLDGVMLLWCLYTGNMFRVPIFEIIRILAVFFLNKKWFII